MRHPPQYDPSQHDHYNPNQPRVPAGQPDGGQWTGGQSDEPGKLKLAFFRDPRRRLDVVQRAVELGLLALYERYSQFNTRNQRAVLEAKAVEYDREAAPNGEFDVRKFQLLSQSQVDKTCDRLKDVQRLTDEAAADVWAGGKPMSQKEFGDKVHWFVANRIGTAGENINPNFVAEISLTKMAQDGVSPEEIERIRRFGFPYGTPGSVRIDALERKGENTVCVYDIKTGNAKLSPARIAEIFSNVRSIYGDAVKIIITEVRPNGAYRFSPK